MNIKVSLDHIVIAATDLASGVEYVKQTLGVEMPYGGEHEKMATHNHLMSLGNNRFLEVIAINPDAQQPDRPRWYGLDDPYLRTQIHKQPQLISWVVNTPNIEVFSNKADFQFGEIEPITRGDLQWYFALPEDGRLLAWGLIPYLMQWNTDVHPANDMVDLGCRLINMEIYHPNPTWLKIILKQIDALQFVGVREVQANQTAYMTAVIDTPTGNKELSSRINCF